MRHKKEVTHSRNSFKMVYADYQERNAAMSHYRHLSTTERKSIFRMQGEGKSLQAMSRTLGRSASTISRELRRNEGEGKITLPARQNGDVANAGNVAISKRYFPTLLPRRWCRIGFWMNNGGRKKLRIAWERRTILSSYVSQRYISGFMVI